MSATTPREQTADGSAAAPLDTFGVSRRDGDGALMMEGVSLADLADRHGTPLYVYSKAAFTRAFSAFDSAIKAARGSRPYTICYAVKANSNLAVLNVFARLGAGFDIVSGGELARVLKAGGDPRKVVFSGLGKTEAEMAAALHAGIKCFNIESEAELDRLNTVATRMGKRAPMSLRVNPDVDAMTHPYISTGLKNNKFGVAFDRARAVYQKAASLPGIEVVGVDCHIGSQLLDVSPLVEAMGKVVALADDLKRDGIELHHVCPGGGIGITYQNETTIDLTTYATALQQALGDRPMELLMEPGRIMVGNAGVLLTRVEFVKPTEHRNFYIVDAAMNDLIRPALYQAHHRVVSVSAPVGEALLADVVGPVCESSDVLAYQRELAVGADGLIAILSAGAYGFVMASNYNTRPRAAELLVDGERVHVVRERESVASLFASESVPV